MKRIIFLSCLLLTPLLAMAAGEIELKSSVEKVVTYTDSKGVERERLAATDTVLPGDVVIYTITYSNISDKAVDEVVITNPVPDATRYLADSARGENTTITFSVDGKTFTAADELTVTDKDGKTRPAVADDYAAVRWVFNGELPAGQRGIASFRAQVK